MGIFSKIKKGIKKVFKGVKKVFKKVGKAVVKFLDSDLGKALMIAAAVFTGGAALMAGIGNAAAATGGFLTKFVAGAKGFMAGLAQPMATWKGAVSGFQSSGMGGILSGAAKGSGALQAGTTTGLQNTINPVGENVPKDAAMASSSQPSAATAGLETGQPEAAAAAANTEPAAAEAAAAVGESGSSLAGAPVSRMGSEAAVQGAEGGNWLSKAGGAIMDFGKSTGGGLIASNLIQGYASGKAEEDYLKHGGYYDRQWADPRQRMILDEASRASSGGFLSRAEKYRNTRAGAVTPSSSRIQGYQRGERSSGYAGG